MTVAHLHQDQVQFIQVSLFSSHPRFVCRNIDGHLDDEVPDTWGIVGTALHMGPQAYQSAVRVVVPSISSE